MKSSLTLALLALAACESTASTVDSGVDLGADTGVDSGSDAGVDAGPLPACGSDSPLALTQCVEVARYSADLATVAMERVPESTHWQTVQDLCATRLESLGRLLHPGVRRAPPSFRFTIEASGAAKMKSPPLERSLRLA